ncbi:MAG: pyridoxamine 5'-phosphate oxidase [Dehalococcoidia bacterium]|nr:pyridoxamine 5'-phosphate oxidase [Dehalococcoidia bacterium]
MSLTLEQKTRLTEFCKTPLLAVLATVYRRGAPQAVPVWYEFDGESFIVTSSKERVKVKNVLRDNRVSLCIIDTSHQGRGFNIRGTAQVVEEGAQEATRRLAIRYLGEERGRESSAGMAAQERVIIRITPEELV